MNISVAFAWIRTEIDVAVLPVNIVLQLNLEVGGVGDVCETELDHTKLEFLLVRDDENE